MLQEEGTACANPLTWEGAWWVQGTEEWPLLWQKKVGAKERLLSQESPDRLSCSQASSLCGEQTVENRRSGETREEAASVVQMTWWGRSGSGLYWAHSIETG